MAKNIILPDVVCKVEKSGNRYNAWSTDGTKYTSEITWGYLLMVGISSQLGQLFLTFGYELLSASRAAMTSYLQVPFSVIAGIIIFHDVITFNFMIGTLMILFTILIIIIKENTNSHAI